MVDLGKCRIRQLKNYQWKMMLSSNFKEFSQMFAPFEENYAIEVAERIPSPRLTQKQQQHMEEMQSIS